VSIAEEGDPHPWRAALALGLFAIVGGMIASTLLQSWLGHTAWWIPGDAWISLRAAHYVPQGTYPLIYETGTVRDVFAAGPFVPLALAPVAAIGDLFHLQESYPFPRAYPDMWLVFGPYALASAVPLLYATRALATQLGVRSGRLLLQWMVLLFAFVPIAVLYGHYEDVIALALLLFGFRDLFAARELRGALLVAAAILFKQWSLLAVPVYVAACPPGLRVRAAVRSAVAPVLFMGAFVAVDFRYASRALLQPGTWAGLGHSALWLPASADYVSRVPARPGALVVALLGGWSIRRERDPVAIVSALGCVLLSRFLFESVVHAYYLAPGIAVLMLAERVRGSSARRIVTEVMLGAALLLVFPFHPQRVLWWIVVYALTGALLVRPVTRVVSAGRRTESGAVGNTRTRVLTP
jgi:hypothetical protein